MAKGEKQLLLVDLCARLPYKVMGHATWTYIETNGEVKYAEKDRPIEINDLYDIWNFKPYLRPLSSMTEEERKEYHSICDSYTNREGNKYYFNNVLTIDWYNRKHFDYRGLIDKRLALVAPKEMYKI